MGTGKLMILAPLHDFEVPGSNPWPALQALQIGGASVNINERE